MELWLGQCPVDAVTPCFFGQMHQLLETLSMTSSSDEFSLSEIAWKLEQENY